MEQTISLFWNWGLSSRIEGHCILVWCSIPISSPVRSSGRAGQSFANVSLDMLQVQPELALLYAILCHHKPLGSVAFWGWMTAPPQNKGLSLSHLIAVPMPRYLCLNKYSASAAPWIRDLKKLCTFLGREWRLGPSLPKQYLTALMLSCLPQACSSRCGGLTIRCIPLCEVILVIPPLLLQENRDGRTSAALNFTDPFTEQTIYSLHID